MADQTPAFRNGWRGVMEGEVRELTKESVQGILHRGGTILGSSGANPYHEGRIEKVRQTFADLALDELIAIGSEGTLGAAAHMTEEGMSVIGVPKTIDNDLSGSEACIGVQHGRSDRHRRHRPAAQHRREPQPRHRGGGDGAELGMDRLVGGSRCGAHMILIPERPFDLAEVCADLRRRHLGGHLFSIVVVAEGGQPDEGTMAPVN